MEWFIAGMVFVVALDFGVSKLLPNSKRMW